MTERRAPAVGVTPERDHDVSGVVGVGDEYGNPPYLTQPSDDHYLGMFLLSGDPLVRGWDGSPMTASDLREGDHISVWVEGGCQESFPVSCGVVEVVVTSAGP